MLWAVDAVPLLPEHDMLGVVRAIAHASLQQHTSILFPLEVRHSVLPETAILQIPGRKPDDVPVCLLLILELSLACPTAAKGLWLALSIQEQR